MQHLGFCLCGWALKAAMVGVAVGLFILPTPAAACSQDGFEASALIERIRFKSGEGYRMTYCIDLPLPIYWQFKTDFNNEFLTSNPHIATHHFLGRKGNVVLTENRYTHNTKRLFRWQTTVDSKAHRLNFILLNPEEAGQRYHSGSIRLKDKGHYTEVQQEAYFQFSGAAFWAFYPWRGGMRSFLQSFVAWEQETARAWQPHYEAQLKQKELFRLRLNEIFSVNKRYPEK